MDEPWVSATLDLTGGGKERKTVSTVNANHLGRRSKSTPRWVWTHDLTVSKTTPNPFTPFPKPDPGSPCRRRLLWWWGGGGGGRGWW